jgi:predicted MFS family arabinose efflux permease
MKANGEQSNPQARPAEVTGRRLLAQESLGPLRHRDFRLLWMGMLFSGSTVMFQFFAIGRLIENYFPRILGPDFPVLLMLGIAGLTRGAGMVLFAILGGVLADRYDRRNLALVTQFVALILVGLFSLLIALDWIELWQVFPLLFLTSATQTFDLPARQALIPQLVERREIANAVALFTGAMQTSTIYAALLAGYVLDTMGIAGSYAASGVGHAGLLLALFFIRPRGRPAAISGQSNMVSQMGEGFRYARSNYAVLGILVVTFVVSGFGVATIMTLSPYWMFRVMGISATTWGVVAAMWGGGSVATAYFLSGFSRWGQRRSVFLGSALLFSGMVIAWGVTRSLVGLGVVEFFMGVSFSALLVSGAAIIQILVPDELRGRVMSLFSLNQALSLANGITVGAIAQAVGVTTAWPLIGIGLTAAMACSIVALPVLRRGLGRHSLSMPT